MHTKIYFVSDYSFFDIDKSNLPRIRSSSEVYGHMSDTSLQGVPISGVSVMQIRVIAPCKC